MQILYLRGKLDNSLVSFFFKYTEVFIHFCQVVDRCDNKNGSKIFNMQSWKPYGQSQQMRDAALVLVLCWPNVYDVGPTQKQQRFVKNAGKQTRETNQKYVFVTLFTKPIS